MLETSPRIAPRMTPGVRLAIGLMSVGPAAVLARAALVAAENPALRIVPPGDAFGHRPLFDPDGMAAPEGSLIGHVLRQIGHLNLTPRDRVLALVLVESLEPTGWLGVEIGVLARDCAVAPDALEAVLRRLQTLEPAGIFARSLAECLWLQAEDRDIMDEPMRAVLDRLPRLALGDLAGLAEEAGLTVDAVEHAARQIRALNPKPGLAFSGPTPPAFPPDLVARRGAKGWTVEPHPARTQIELRRGIGDPQVARLWKQAIERRADLGLVIAELIVQRQSSYLDGQGELSVLTSAELSAVVGVHISTVNRVLKGTFMATPSIVAPLRDWTARPIQADGGTSAIFAKSNLKRLLSDPANAGLSDANLSKLLAEMGSAVARRTVNKYRAELSASSNGRNCIDVPPWRN